MIIPRIKTMPIQIKETIPNPLDNFKGETYLVQSSSSLKHHATAKAKILKLPCQKYPEIQSMFYDK